MLRETFDSEARLSWVLAVLAGVLGATAFTHSAGYFVTFMTGNAQRAVLGYFRDDVVLSVTAGLLLLSFVAGVVVAWCVGGISGSRIRTARPCWRRSACWRPHWWTYSRGWKEISSTSRRLCWWPSVSAR